MLWTTESSCTGVKPSLYHSLLSPHGLYYSNLMETWFLTGERVQGKQDNRKVLLWNEAELVI